MTIEIAEYRCPTCGHILGEEEYRNACSNHDKARQEIRGELSEELANKHQEEMQQERAKYQREKQQLEMPRMASSQKIETEAACHGFLGFLAPFCSKSHFRLYSSCRNLNPLKILK